MVFLWLFFLVLPAFAGDEVNDDLFEDYVQTGEEESGVPDPLYHFNHAMYTFNDRLYFWALKPAARGYGYIIPRPVRTCVKNVFDNLLFPVRFVNSIFQGKARGAGSELKIFAVNSTVGLLGLFRPAQEKFQWKSSPEDLGQTLGSYKLKEGFYLVLPFLGPSTLRDLVGTIGDSFVTPISYVTPYEAALGIRAFDILNSTSLRIGDYEALKRASLDPYVAIKDGYIQLRRKKVLQ